MCYVSRLHRVHCVSAVSSDHLAQAEPPGPVSLFRSFSSSSLKIIFAGVTAWTGSSHLFVVFYCNDSCTRLGMITVVLLSLEGLDAIEYSLA